MANITDRFLSSRWLPIAMAALAIGACMNLAGLAVALVLIQGQAQQGQMARDRQQAVFPVSERVYIDAYKRHVISLADLACFRSGTNCSTSRRTP